MKTVLIEKPFEIAVTDTEMPVPKEGEALLKVLYCGICGADVASYTGNQPFTTYPRIPGHEFSAQIVSIPENDRNLKPGDIVTANPYFNCGSCYSCRRGLVNACMDNQTIGCQRDGAFSEYITMPLERIYDSKGLDPKTLAAIEPFCISYHGVQRANIQKGDKVLVIGAGTIGVLAACAAKALGGEVYLCDVAPDKLRYAMDTFGFAGTILNVHPQALQKAVEEITGATTIGGSTAGLGFDVCIEAVGLPETFQNCIDAAAFGGRVVLIGIGKRNLDFNFTLIQKKELNVYGSRNALKKDFTELIDLVNSGEVDLGKIITHVYPLDQIGQALADFDQNSGQMLKVMIDFTSR
jgi:2-desacetyl-2-hydroxyethyl bacteriochlorophyllide A dehydrogenase